MDTRYRSHIVFHAKFKKKKKKKLKKKGIFLT